MYPSFLLIFFLQSLTMAKNVESIGVPITEGINAEHTLYRIKRGSTVHVHPDAGLLGREIVLYTNYPEEGK